MANPEVRECDREVGFTPQERTFLRTVASRQKRPFERLIDSVGIDKRSNVHGQSELFQRNLDH
jgi:hypothetical protein